MNGHFPIESTVLETSEGVIHSGSPSPRTAISKLNALHWERKTNKHGDTKFLSIATVNTLQWCHFLVRGCHFIRAMSLTERQFLGGCVSVLVNDHNTKDGSCHNYWLTWETERTKLYALHLLVWWANGRCRYLVGGEYCILDLPDSLSGTDFLGAASLWPISVKVNPNFLGLPSSLRTFHVFFWLKIPANLESG